MTATITAPTSSDGGIVVLGSAKSGTTALFYAIRNSLTNSGLTVTGLFEPSTPAEVDAYVQAGTDDIPFVKALLGPALRWKPGTFAAFDKKIVIYRDPRDNIISRIVFMLVRLVDPKDKEKLAELVALFRRKEIDPSSLSVMSMIKAISEMTGREDLALSMRNNALLPATISRDAAGEYFMMPYDDLVQQQFGPLSAYLGRPIDPKFEVEDRHAYVIRTKGSGDWKNWFLDDDIEFFAKDVAEDFRLLGFDPDEKANADRVIPPSICSEYVAKQFERMNEKRRTRKKERRSLAQAVA